MFRGDRPSVSTTPMHRTLARTATVCMLILWGAVAHAEVRPFEPDERVCRPPSSTQQSWLDPAVWGAFAEFTRVCSIGRPGRRAALLLVSVWADTYYAGKPGGTVTVAMPRPILFFPDGRAVGELPVNFPSDPPAELVVRFADWQRGLPHEIRLCVSSPTASGDSMLPPLRYQAATQHYAPATAAGPARRPGDCHRVGHAHPDRLAAPR